MLRAPYRLVPILALLGAQGAWAKTEVIKTSAGSPAHWRRGEITVGWSSQFLSRTISPTEIELAIERAARVWNGVRAGQPRLSLAAWGFPDVTLQFCRDQWRGRGQDLGRTEFSASLRDGTVTAATIEINDCNHVFATPDKPRPGRPNLEAVVAHELGHALGLGHSDSPSSIMHPHGTGEIQNRPNREDEDALALLYFGRRSDPVSSATAILHEAPMPSSQPPQAPLAFASPLSPTAKPSAAAALQAKILPAPAESVQVLSLTTSEGRPVTVYTCEPTLLPPMTAAPSDRELKLGTRRHHRDRAK